MSRWNAGSWWQGSSWEWQGWGEQQQWRGSAWSVGRSWRSDGTDTPHRTDTAGSHLEAADQGHAADSSSCSAAAAAVAPAATPAAAVEASAPAADPYVRLPLDRILLLCPDPGRGNFTAAYDRQPPSPSFASVNAGNGRSLRVGGSGLNGQFERDLQQCGLPVRAFQALHQEMMQAACRNPGTIVEATPQARRAAGCEAAVARVGSSDGSAFVAIDIFEAACRPGSSSNVGMVYCVGPDRREFRDDDAFLACLDEIGYGIVVTCAGYASNAKSVGSTPLQRVRVALVSGGKYAGKVRTDRVAENLLQGIMRGIQDSPSLQGGSLPLRFELAYADGCFARALSKLLQATNSS